MGSSKSTRDCGAVCQALEPRLLLAANPLNPAADRLGAALSGVSAEFISFKSSKKTGPFRASNHLLHIADKRIAIEAAADDPAALKSALTSLRFRRGNGTTTRTPLTTTSFCSRSTIGRRRASSAST